MHLTRMIYDKITFKQIIMLNTCNKMCNEFDFAINSKDIYHNLYLLINRKVWFFFLLKCENEYIKLNENK